MRVCVLGQVAAFLVYTRTYAVGNNCWVYVGGMNELPSMTPSCTAVVKGRCQTKTIPCACLPPPFNSHSCLSCEKKRGCGVWMILAIAASELVRVL